MSNNVANHNGRHGVSEHTVRFFDSTESRSKSVATFIAEGYERGEPLIVIGRARAWLDIHAELVSLAIPVDSAMAEKRLIVCDAATMLRRICHHDSPVPSLFENVIGTMVRRASKGVTVRAYGAMVDVLAQQGDFDFAVRLEELWNTLARQVPLTLLCGYDSAHFVSAGAQQALSTICGTHDRIDMEPQDQLGTWLLGQAGIASADIH